MMYRKSEENLVQWLHSSRRKPLVIRGARQVGKSTLVRQFAEAQGVPLAEVNLERYPLLNEVFKANDIHQILLELEGAVGQSIVPGETILFLDEIQATPAALAALRYFYEDYPQLAVVAAGSLLEFVLAKHEFSMPVGRIQYLHLAPMVFTEFLMALGEQQLVETIELFQVGDTISQSLHQRLLLRQREYLFVGGMPECVQAYQETSQLAEARLVQRSIMQTYQDDFAKYAKAVEQYRLHKVLRALPHMIGNKVKYAHISREDRAYEIRKAIDLLTQARLLLPAYHSHCQGIPLRASINENQYKLFFVDIGLLNYLCGLDWKAITSLDERQLVNEGVLAEQFIAQHLAYAAQGAEAPELFYWLREQKSSNAEVDFVIQQRTQIIPLEVKAGKSGRLKSLHQFIRQHHTPQAYRFDLNLPSQQVVSHQTSQKERLQFELHSFPLYLIQRIVS